MTLDLNAEERIPIHRMLTPADWVTLCNALLGFTAIVAAANDEIRAAFSLILLAVLLDGVDGGLSRIGLGGGRLGDKLDTLSDLISFCVAPAFVFWQANQGAELFPNVPVPAWLQPYAWGQVFIAAACVTYLAAGMLRLARFDYLKGGARHDYYVGVTTPSAAVVLVSVALLGWDTMPAIITLAAVSALMVSRLRLPKIRRTLVLPSVVLLSGGAILGGAFHNAMPILLLVFTLFYLVFGPGYIRRRYDEDGLDVVPG